MEDGVYDRLLSQQPPAAVLEALQYTAMFGTPLELALTYGHLLGMANVTSSGVTPLALHGAYVRACAAVAKRPDACDMARALNVAFAPAAPAPAAPVAPMAPAAPVPQVAAPLPPVPPVLTATLTATPVAKAAAPPWIASGNAGSIRSASFAAVRTNSAEERVRLMNKNPAAVKRLRTFVAHNYTCVPSEAVDMTPVPREEMHGDYEEYVRLGIEGACEADALKATAFNKLFMTLDMNPSTGELPTKSRKRTYWRRRDSVRALPAPPTAAAPPEDGVRVSVAGFGKNGKQEAVDDDGVEGDAVMNRGLVGDDGDETSGETHDLNEYEFDDCVVPDHESEPEDGEEDEDESHEVKRRRRLKHRPPTPPGGEDF